MPIAGLSPHIINGQRGPVQRETKTERPQREWPFKCLMHQAAEKDPMCCVQTPTLKAKHRAAEKDPS